MAETSGLLNRRRVNSPTTGSNPVLSANFEGSMRVARFAVSIGLLICGAVALADEPLKFTVVGIDCEACAPPPAGCYRFEAGGDGGIRTLGTGIPRTAV